MGDKSPTPIDDSLMRIKWGRHQDSLITMLQHLLETESSYDVSIVVENEIIPVHKIILMASSPYFNKILNMRRSGSDKDSMIFLVDTTLAQAKALVHFMYYGEVILPSHEIQGFMKLANTLLVRGLALPKNSEENQSSTIAPRSNSNSRSRYNSRSSSNSLSDTKSKCRNNQSPSNSNPSYPMILSSTSAGAEPPRERKYNFARPLNGQQADKLTNSKPFMCVKAKEEMDDKKSGVNAKPKNVVQIEKRGVGRPKRISDKDKLKQKFKSFKSLSPIKKPGSSVYLTRNSNIIKSRSGRILRHRQKIQLINEEKRQAKVKKSTPPESGGRKRKNSCSTKSNTSDIDSCTISQNEVKAAKIFLSPFPPMIMNGKIKRGSPVPNKFESDSSASSDRSSSSSIISIKRKEKPKKLQPLIEISGESESNDEETSESDDNSSVKKGGIKIKKEIVDKSLSAASVQKKTKTCSRCKLDFSPSHFKFHFEACIRRRFFCKACKKYFNQIATKPTHYPKCKWANYQDSKIVVVKRRQTTK